MTASKRFLSLRLKDLILLAAIAATTVLVVMLLMLRAETNLANGNIHFAARRAAEEFQRLVGGVEGSLRSARNYGVQPGDIDAARHYFNSSVFPNIEKLAGISLAEQDGRAFYLLRDGKLMDVRSEGAYEPETRVWFQGALAAPGTNDCFWTGIYRFRTIDEDGISVSLSWTVGKGRPVVVAYDILLDDFFAAVQRLAPTPASQAFLFLPDGTSYIPESAAGEGSNTVAAAGAQIVRKGLAVWNDGPPEHDRSDVQITTTRIEGETWWCGFVPLTKSDRAVWMCVMVPKSDLVEDVSVQRGIYAGVGFIVLAALLVIYLIVSKRRSEPGIMPPPDEEQIRALIAKGENSVVEFKSTMRMNLHSQKPGREIEQAWLKGVAAFLNTNGGTLLLGVTDAGEITGLEQDVFESDDKCRLHFKNLIAKGLGADLSQYIRFSLVVMNERTVGVVQCVKSTRPVYLRDGNKEAFYIRNGPSSDELPASRMVDYISENWK